MSEHSVADAKSRLSELIERALAGEAVVITRDGRPVVEIRPVQPPERRITDADVDWLAAHRAGRITPDMPAGELVSRMRDEDWER